MDKIEKFLRKIDRKQRERLLKVIAQLANNDILTLNIVPMKGFKNCYRCHVGDMRILFMSAAGKNVIYDIEYRGNVYKK